MTFKKAMVQVRRSEGGYSFDLDDPGKETYCGISRRFFPKWAGWAIVDSVKREHGGTLKTNYKIRNNYLNILVNEFYLKYFWKPLRCDNITNPILAEHLFDCGINLGKRSAVRFFQNSMNGFHRKTPGTGGLVLDGLIGPKTIGALNVIEGSFTNFLVEKRIDLYFNKCYKKPVKFKYLRGWCMRSLKYLEKK